jgi:alpha-tubulin suppressor-like RCC1 family protein
VIGLQSHVTSVSGNIYFTCAVQLGSAKCWGYNFYGQLGNATTTDQHVPRQVVGLTSGVTRISTQWYSACARLSTGGVRCWGYGGNGELGNDSARDSSAPSSVHLI